MQRIKKTWKKNWVEHTAPSGYHKLAKPVRKAFSALLILANFKNDDFYFF
jgi:hypothetical protein